MVDITNKLNASREEVFNQANGGDSQLAGGAIWPLSGQESAQDGDDLTGYEFVRLQGGAFTDITLFKISENPGGTLSNPQLTTKPYTIDIGASTVEVKNNSGSVIELDGGNVKKTTSEWFSETVRHTGFSDLQTAIDLAVANGTTLDLMGGTYISSSRITVSDNLNINVINDTKILFDKSIDCTDLGLFESTVGEISISGKRLTIDAQMNTGNGAIISSLQRYIKADNIVELINLPSGTGYYAAFQVNGQGTSMEGQGWFKALRTDNVLNGIMVYGNSIWWDESAPFDSSFELGGDCVIKCNGGFAYLFNKLLYARVGGCLIQDSNGYYKSFSTNLGNGDWTTNNSTINLNTFTTTTSGGIFTTIPDIDIGQDYFCVFGGETDASSIEIRNGTTGTSPLITTVIGQVALFNAASTSIYIRNLGAGTTQISDFAVFKFSDVTSNIFQCASADIEGARYIGTRRGPVIGIDCKNFTVRATKTMGATLTGLDIDTESLPGEPQLYPDAYGMVYGNICKYIGLRGMFSTCRRLDVVSNVFYYSADTTESTTKACMRFNTRNETESNSRVMLTGNRAIGCNGASFVSVFRGKVIVGENNMHDSTSILAFTTDRTGETPPDSAAIEFRRQGTSIYTLNSVDNIVSVGNAISKTDNSVTSLNLPNFNFAGCEGFEGKILRSTNTNNITISTSAGTINGGPNYIWPSADRILIFVCISDTNDYIVTSA